MSLYSGTQWMPNLEIYQKNKISTPVVFYFHPSIGQILYLALTTLPEIGGLGWPRGLQGSCAGSRSGTPEGKVGI